MANQKRDAVGSEGRRNLLLGFTGALRNSAIGAGLDTSRVIGSLNDALGKPVVSLRPIYDLLVGELRVAPIDAAGVVLFIKGNEARYGVETELPPTVAALSEEDSATARGRFGARRAVAPPGAPAARAPNENSGARPRPGAVRSSGGSDSGGPRVRPAGITHEQSGKNNKAPPANEEVEIQAQPTKVIALFGAVFALLFVVAVPVGLGAHEEGWGINNMWSLRHGVLLVAAVVGVAMISKTNASKGLAELFALGSAPMIAVGVIGGGIMGLLGQVLVTVHSNATFVLPIVLGLALLHVFTERFFFHVVQIGLGTDSSLAVVGVIAMQVVYVLTYASVAGGSIGTAATWFGYVVVTTAGPAAFLSRSGSLWPGLCWHLAFTLATVGMAYSATT